MEQRLAEEALNVSSASLETAPSASHAQNTSFQLESGSGAKQKRRRTSPRDTAFLEEAYLRNSKPDKEERLRIVSQVELGEKEVQIWFQNRRQNDRRKSKPLLPHELIPHFRNAVPAEAQRQLPSPRSSQESPEQRVARRAELTRDVGTSAAALAVQSLLNDERPLLGTDHPALSQPLPDTKNLNTPPSSFDTSNLPRPSALQPPPPTSQPDPQIGKKRSYEVMTADQPEVSEQETAKDAKSLRRTSSFIRLAVSADGSMKVRTNNEPTPSPPKERQPAPQSFLVAKKPLARAQSDVTNIFKDIYPPPKTVGRSRDARTWEFFCDRGARDALILRAEEDRSGSAAGAISLIRSSSQKKLAAMSPNPNRHNFRRSVPGARVKPVLTRTQSSMARLQSSDDTIDEADYHRSQKSHVRFSSSGDSDKENWLPGTQRLPAASRRTRNAGTEEPVHDRPRGLNQAVAGKHKGDDLDGVQALLSLSQGNWQ